MSSSLSSIKNFLALPSSTSDCVTSANGSVAQAAVRACWLDGGGCLFKAGRLLTFSTFRVGAYLRGRLFKLGCLNKYIRYARIFFRSHYLFPSKHIFAPNGGYCVCYPSNLFRNVRSFDNWGIILDIPGF